MFYFWIQMKRWMMEQKRLLSIIAGVVAILMIIFVGRGVMNSPKKEKVMVTNAVHTTRVEVESTTMMPQNCYVDIKGEILRPGVYEFSCESRIQEVIKKAGGFTEEADETKINLAQKITDQMQIIVPKLNASQDGGVIEGDSKTNQKSPSSSKQGIVNVNTATLEELQTLKGIGKKKAEAILQYRKEHGAFHSKEDLLQVKGIGKKALEAIESQVSVQ